MSRRSSDRRAAKRRQGRRGRASARLRGVSRRIRRLCLNLYGRATARLRGFGRRTDEALAPRDPADLSEPSAQYYRHLANRFSYARVVLYMALLVFVVVTMLGNRRLITYRNLYYLVKDIGASTAAARSEANRLNYPVSPSGADFALYRGGLIAAGGEEITALSGSGRQTLSLGVSFTDPSVRASERYFLAFDRGRTGFSVCNAFSCVYAEQTDFPVYDACAADNGNFAVLTRSRDYVSEVRLYDADMRKLADCRLNGYVTALTADPAGDTFAIVSAEAEDGRWITKVTIIRLKHGARSESVTWSGALTVAAAFLSDDRLAVIGRDRLRILRPDAAVTAEVPFEGEDAVSCAFGAGRVALLLKSRSDLSRTEVAVLGRNGREIYRVPIGAGGGPAALDPARLAFGGDALYVTARGALLRVSRDGRSVSSAPIGREALEVLPLDANRALVCYPAYAARLNEGDFLPVEP